MKNIFPYKQFINESSNLLDLFSDDENEILGFLMHDKEHVLGRGSVHKKRPELDTIFQKIKSSKVDIPLWRGIYKEELEKYNDLYEEEKIGITTRYLSFSESKDLAIEFSEASEANTLLELIGGQGLLNYHQWVRDLAEQELEMNGGDTEDYNYLELIDTAEEELEHIMNVESRIQFIGKRNEGELTIFTIKQIP